MEGSTIKYSDAFLITFLLLKNHSPLYPPEKNPEDGNRLTFEFSNTKELQRDATSFLDDEEVSIRIRTFSKRYRDVMAYIHNPNPLQIKNLTQIDKEVK